MSREGKIIVACIVFMMLVLIKLTFFPTVKAHEPPKSALPERLG